MGTSNICAVVILFALLFIETSHELIGGSSYTADSNVSCIHSERQALIKLKQGLKDGASRLSSWVGMDCCAWKGVGCSTKTGHVVKLDLRNPFPFHFYDCCGDNHTAMRNYLAIQDSNRLEGEISPSLLDLKRLRNLDLSVNNFSDMRIPDFIGSLPSLTHLDLSYSFFSGKIPHHLGNLSTLRYLNLSSNYYLDSPRPDSLGRLSSLVVLDLSQSSFDTSMPQFLLNMSSLAYVDLSSNRFNGLIPRWLGNQVSLSVLKLGWNAFQGPIPNELGNLTQLAELHLSGNGLKGAIPNELGNLTQLAELHLSGNELEGEIPNNMRNLCSLRVLDLSRNYKLSGKVSTSILSSFGCIHNSLKELDLSLNQFTDFLPNHLGEFRNLVRLSILDNSFYGPLPSSLGNLSCLRELDTGYNQLNGTIPVSLWQLSKLEYLGLSSNSFTGTVSQLHFAKLQSLLVLDLSWSFLVLNVSSRWVPPFQLKRILMASHKLGPKFPPWLQTQKHVEELFLKNLSISDIPNWFPSWSSCIPRLDLSDNHFRGNLPTFQKCNDSGRMVQTKGLMLSSNGFEGPLPPIPSDVAELNLSNNSLSGPILLDYNNVTPKLQSFVVSNNHLTGGIPMSLCKAKNMCVIDLSNNQLSGSIPWCLGKLVQLWVLDLSNNSLYGQIPNSLGIPQRLMSLHLSNNRFHGKLPSSLQNLTNLLTLDLGQNEFTDVIPPWMGDKLSSLQLLSLQSNNFYGNIPQDLCRLSNLQLLNLAQNNIVGNIPGCFHNFSAMIVVQRGLTIYIGYIDTLFQFMKGRELEYTTTLPYLTSIDLSSNNLVGEIPEELMELLGLENLNLSRNHLEGKIPEKIGYLKQLESLDLSENNLTGPIPASLSALYYLSYLNMSSNNLSGRIPRGNQLQTFDNQSYIGNDGLCGAPLVKSCPDEPSYGDHDHVVETNYDGDEIELVWFYAGIGPGFLFGFLGVCFTLYFKKSWRHGYFQLLEDSYNRVFVAIAMKANWPRRKFHRGRFEG